MSGVEPIVLGSLILGGSTLASGALVASNKPKAPTASKPRALTAPTARTDTGAIVRLGADEVKNTLVNVPSTTEKKKRTRDIIGSLGSGSGLSI